MARLLEDGIKALLSSDGMSTPEHQTVRTAEEAGSVAMAIGFPVVVKALVPIGRRGKAGAVQICESREAVASVAGNLLSSRIGPFPVEAVLVEEWMDIRRELYFAVEISAGRPEYSLLLSARGGVEIESRANTVTRISLDPHAPPGPDDLARYWLALDDTLPVGELGRVGAAAIDLFVHRDLTLLEINPLAVLSNGTVCFVGALAAVDDNAVARQSDISAWFVEGSDRSWRPETELEARVATINADRSQRGSARYLELEGGNIGFLCGGGGASLLLFDALVQAGGQPANYSEFGGNPTEQRVYDLTRVVLDKPGIEGLFVAHNLTNNTQVDVVAAGVTRALQVASLSEPFPVVAREAGLHDEEGRRIFEAAGVRCFGEETSLNAAAVEMVAALREIGR